MGLLNWSMDPKPKETVGEDEILQVSCYTVNWIFQLQEIQELVFHAKDKWAYEAKHLQGGAVSSAKEAPKTIKSEGETDAKGKTLDDTVLLTLN